jgi:hypothetical protein
MLTPALMARPECDYCKRDISKPSLVRCSSQRCPLKASRGAALRGVMAGICGLGLLAAFGAIGAIWLFAPSSQRRGAGETHVEATSSGPRTNAIELGGNIRHWGDGLFGSGHSDGREMPVAAMPTDSSLPDPRAASRVQTFSCSGSLSASRALICTNWDLATTDYNLALTYNTALVRSRHPDALRRAHDAFLTGLDTIGTDADKLRAYYRSWQEQLSRG